MRTRAFVIPQPKGTQVDIRKKPEVYTPPSLIISPYQYLHRFSSTKKRKKRILVQEGQANSQSARHTTRNHRLNASNHTVHHRYHPNHLPISPLNGTGIRSCDHMYSAHDDQGPVESEAPHRFGVVEVDILRSAHGEGPV